MPSLKEMVDRVKRATNGEITPVLEGQPVRTLSGARILDRIDKKAETVMVCKKCEKPKAFKKYNFVELRRFHGEGLCDGCQEYGSVAMWLWEGGVQWQSELHDVRLNEIRRRDQEIAERYRR